MPVMTFAEYAKHRGVSKPSVTYAVRDGRIPTVTGANGKRAIDSEVADLAWEQTTAHEKRRHNPGFSPVDPEPETEITYAKARALNEHFKSRLAQLNFEREQGLLVDADQVAKKWATLAGQVRTKVLGIPSKARQRIHDLTPEMYIELEAIVRETLEDLANSENGEA